MLLETDRKEYSEIIRVQLNFARILHVQGLQSRGDVSGALFRRLEICAGWVNRPWTMKYCSTDGSRGARAEKYAMLRSTAKCAGPRVWR